MSESETKNCSRCGELQPVDNFYWVSRKGGPRRGECKACRSEIRALQKDPDWRPSCPQCGRERDRVGPGRRLCWACFEKKYDAEERRENGSHRLKLKACSACGMKRLREDHMRGSHLCPICRSVPQGRRTRLKRLYNMTPRDYLALLEDQCHACWICRRSFSKRRVPHVDHKHSEPMLVRGLTCATCNTILGLAKDNPDRLRGAAKYLEAPPAQYVLPGLVASLEANRREFRPLRRAAA